MILAFPNQIVQLATLPTAGGLEIGDRVDGLGGDVSRFAKPAPAAPELTR